MNSDGGIFALCGDPATDEFRVLENKTHRVVTECYSHTILAGAPCLLFWLCLPVLVLQLRLSRRQRLPWTTLQSIKWLISTILLADRGLLLVLAVLEKITGTSRPVIDYVYPTVVCVTLLAELVMKNECRRFGIRSSGVLFCFWLSMALFGTPEFVAWVTLGSDQTLVADVNLMRYISYLVFYPLVLLQVFLVALPDPFNVITTKEESPEDTASFISQQLLWWYGELVYKGHKKPLQVEDVYPLNADMTTEYLAKEWNREWNYSLRDYEIRKSGGRRNASGSMSAPLLGEVRKGYGTTQTDDNQKGETEELPSIVGVIWRLFKWDFIGSSLVKLMSDLLAFTSPIFLSLLITFTENPAEPLSNGLVYAGLMFVVGILRSLLMNSYFIYMTRVGAKIQSVLTTAVYDKTLCLSAAARRQKTQGEIVNLMAIDVDRFRMITPMLQQFWSTPLQIVIAMFMLSQTVGWSVVTGILLMISIIPLNFFISILTKKWTVEQMRLKDQRIHMTNEVLSGIRVVKLYAWEPAMEKTINDIRLKEVHLIRKASIVKTMADLLNIATPFLVALVTFATYTLSSPTHVLTPQIAFVSLNLFSLLRGPLMMAAELISQTVQVVVSNKRLKEFFVAEQLPESAVYREERADLFDYTLEIDSAQFTWDRSMPPHLPNINLKVERGQLLAVVGTVAAGKSSLLSALLGEMDKVRGYVGVRGSVAYVPQQPWIQNRTLRDNILMEKPYNKVVYDEIIEACALKADFIQLPCGDLTEIGEKGINLSGGQKARVALARAVYQDRDIYLLDDPLSAVDAHVADHIFHKLIANTGLLAKKTRVLVTHGLSFLKETDTVAIMRHGEIIHQDQYERLTELADAVEVLNEAEQTRKKTEVATTSDSEHSTTPGADDELEEDVRSTLSKRSRASRKSYKSATKDDGKMLIEKEKMETGRVKFAVYLEYFHSMGIFKYFIPFLITLVLNATLVMLRNFWLSDWSNDNALNADSTMATPLWKRLAVYAILGFSEVTFLYISMITMILGGVAASLSLHKPLLNNILRSPLSYFDVTPLGRILNRVGKDMETVDLRLSSNFRFLAISFVNVMQIVIIISISNILFVAVILPIFVVYLLILRYFISCSRQLQRLASTTRSPIYSHFGETIQGVSTVRAFQWLPWFKEQNKKTLTTHLRCSYFSMMSNRWLAVRLEFMGNIVILATALLAVWSKANNNMSAGLIGLALSSSFSITFMLNLFVRQVSEVETNVVSVERIREYSVTPTEAAWHTAKSLPMGWPGKGRVTFRDYSTRYREGTELVLKGLNLTFAAAEKVGVVGRTGAGKSSLALALFRIIEPCGGQIILDDVDVGSIGLHDLRENIAIIPQDPVLFSGTLRFNLDPTNRYEDSELWSALEHAHLRDFVETLPAALEHRIDEGGDNISLGQRQLVCLTRALLKKSRVLVLDEATAAVDTFTDSLIQGTIRKEFANATVITIAHRLNTVMDYDRVLVMEQGKVAEFDSPKVLLADQKTRFYSMAKAAKLL